MPTYDFRYQLGDAPGPRDDGSGQVAHDITAVLRVQGSGDPWSPVPGHHKTILLPHEQLGTVMDMPHSTGAERQAKIAAYKDLLVTHRGSQPAPYDTGWTAAGLQIFMDQNDSAVAESARADDFITNVLGQSYPVTFSI